MLQLLAIKKKKIRPIKIVRDLGDNLVQIPAQNKAIFDLTSDSILIRLLKALCS